MRWEIFSSLIKNIFSSGFQVESDTSYRKDSFSLLISEDPRDTLLINRFNKLFNEGFVKKIYLIKYIVGFVTSVLILSFSFCPFVSNKSQNGWTNGAQTFSNDRIFKTNKIRFLKTFKNLQIFMKSAKFLFVFLLNVYKEKRRAGIALKSWCI